MHEYSIVAALLELCEKHAKQNSTDRVTKVIVAFGERNGVEVELFKSAFETFKLDSETCKDSELVIKWRRVRLRCVTCGEESEPEGIIYNKCEYCGAENLEIISGKEMDLLSLEMEANE